MSGSVESLSSGNAFIKGDISPMATELLASSSVIRDPISDHLITPQNSALVVIDYQPSQVSAVRSMDSRSPPQEHRLDGEDRPAVRAADCALDRQRQVRSRQADRFTARGAARRRSAGRSNQRERLGGRRFRSGRARHWPAQTHLLRALDGDLHGVSRLDALREGYEVYPVVDSIGGTSVEAHRAGLERVVQAGGTPISWVALACELQRDWARQETAADIVEIVLTERLLKE